MRTLVLDTASKYLYVAIMENQKITFTRFQEGKNNHSDNLLKVIEEGLEAVKLKVADLDRIILGIGPGSYTGLRVSCTVAKMFAWTKNIPLYIVSSLNLLASGYLTKDGIYAITMIAKKNYVYGKLVEVKNGEVTTIIDDSFMETDKFFAEISKYNYQLIDEAKYQVDPNNLKIEKVEDLHQLSPNYIQREI